VKRDPEFDHGFHASIPRLVRTGYSHLSATQKWLYVCLKDLAGETGTCFRSIRTLEQETGISTGMISESIRALHDTGLIHAEMKSRTQGGKPVWHITIVDIWQANGNVHPTKRRSAGEHVEQERSHSEQTPENVHYVNNNVHSANNKRGERSAGERECSHSETEERKEKKDHFEEEREKEDPQMPRIRTNIVNNRSDVSLSLSSEISSFLSRFTDDELTFWRRWCTIKKCSDKDLTEKMYQCVVKLTPKVSTMDDVYLIYDLAYEGLKAFATSESREANPPELYNLVKVLPKWEQMQARKQQEQEETRKQTEHIPGTGNMQNWTEARLRGEAPPVVYNAPVSPAQQRMKGMNNMAESLPPWLREKLKK